MLFTPLNLKTLHINHSIKDAQKKYNQMFDDLIKNNILSDDFLFKNRSLVFFDNSNQFSIDKTGIKILYSNDFSLRVALFQIELINRFVSRINPNKKLNLKMYHNGKTNQPYYVLNCIFNSNIKIPQTNEICHQEDIKPENPFIPDPKFDCNIFLKDIAQGSSQLALNEMPYSLLSGTNFNFTGIMAYEIGMIVKSNNNIMIDSLEMNRLFSITNNLNNLTIKIEELLDWF